MLFFGVFGFHQFGFSEAGLFGAVTFRKLRKLFCGLSGYRGFLENGSGVINCAFRVAEIAFRGLFWD